MSKLIYTFLKNSFLYEDKFLINDYSKFSDKEIEKEFERYRNYILKNIHNLYEEITIYANQIKIFNTSTLMNFSKIKQMSIYLDQVIITDPLFEISTPTNTTQNIFNEYMGAKKDNLINRKNLVEIIQKFKNAEILVESTYLKFFPTSYFSEPKSEIPFTYSENQYGNILPRNIMDLYYENKLLRSFKKNGQYLTINKNFEIDRTIEVLFKNDDTEFMNMYNLFEREIISINEKERKIEFAMTLPNTPPSKESFDSWVTQSINQSSIAHFRKISMDISLSIKLKAQYITTSSFVSE